MLASVERTLRRAVRETRKAGGARFFVSSAPLDRGESPLVANGVIDLRNDNQSFNFTSKGVAAEARTIGSVQYSRAVGAGEWLIRPVPLDFRRTHVGPVSFGLVFLELHQGFVKARARGRQAVRQVRTRRYTVEIEPVLNVPEYRSVIAGDKGLLRRIAQATSGRIDVWIDDESLVRRMRLTVDKPSRRIRELHYRPVTNTIELFDFGPQGPIEAPV
jgi:hypothetical protein